MGNISRPVNGENVLVGVAIRINKTEYSASDHTSQLTSVIRFMLIGKIFPF